MQRVFAAVLDLPRASVTANFFEEGGNSLTAVRLAHDLGLETGVEAGIADVFAAPSVRAMAERLRREGEEADPFAPLLALRERGIEVRRLCLMDAYPAELWRDRPAPTEADRLRGLLNMAGVDAAEGTEPSTREEVVAAIRATGSPFGSLPEDVLGGVSEMVGHNAKLMREHRTRAWPGRADFFKATLTPEALDERAWAPHVGELAVTGLPCTHPGMVSAESLAKVAEALRE